MLREILIPVTLLLGLSGSVRADLELVWDRVLDVGGESVAYKASALTPAGEIVVAAMPAERDDSAPSSPPFRLWKLDAESGEAKPWLRPAAPGAKDAVVIDRTVLDIKALVSLDDDGALLVVEFIEGRPTFLEIAASGTPVSLKDLSGEVTDLAVFGMVSRGEGKYLLWGHHSFDSRLLEVARPAEVLRARTRDRGKMDFFIDGVKLGDGDLILVEDSGSYDFLFRGPSSVWVRRYGEEMEVLAEKEFPGRHGSVAEAAGLGPVVVYDRGRSDAQDIRVAAMNADLEVVWETPVLQAAKGYSRFSIASLPDGDVAVAGRKGIQLVLTVLDRKGEVKWEFSDDSKASVADYDLLASRDGALYLFSSIYDESDKQSVRVMRFGE